MTPIREMEKLEVYCQASRGSHTFQIPIRNIKRWTFLENYNDGIELEDYYGSVYKGFLFKLTPENRQQFIEDMKILSNDLLFGDGCLGIVFYKEEF